MSERPSSLPISSISIDELKRFLIINGFVSDGPWGKYLERFKFKRDQDLFNVIVPITREIADYDVRLKEALSDLAQALDLTWNQLISTVAVSEHKIFRMRARVGADLSSIPFDEGHALLTNGKALVKSSAVSAFSTRPRSVIRGRVSRHVDHYMERVRLGQSEVGSYIFNILLPRVSTIFDVNDQDNEHGDVVADTLQENIALASEMAISNRVPNLSQMQSVGMSANFCEALYNIIDWSDNVTFEVKSNSYNSKIEKVYSFDRRSLSVLERTVVKLTPEEQPESIVISGTITRLSEPATRRRGSIDLLVRLNGRKRSVRIAFGASDRDTIITAFKEKSTRMLTVKGYLKTGRNGHLGLENASEFDASKRGSLL